MQGQLFLPGFPEGAVRVGNTLSILNKDGNVTYFIGADNYYSHKEDDIQTRRFILASLMENNHIRPCDLERPPLCIPHRTLMNWVGQLRDEGPGSFYRTSGSRKPRVMTPAKVASCEKLLAEGRCVSVVAKSVGIDGSTLGKAISRGAVLRLERSPGVHIGADTGTTKAERSRADAEASAGMGTACTRADERVAAAVGLSEFATTRFEHSRDVFMGGLLAGLPALCANGLLSGIGKYLKLPDGFYSCLHVLLTIGFMALGRIRRPEGLRHVPPGELGKVIGLDRVPEVRTLREKISKTANAGNPEAWMRELSKSWMKDIVPALLASVPMQPSDEELTSDPLLRRFVVVFDREGATHSLFAALWEKRIGAITYRKNVKDVWPENDFTATEVPVPGGGSTRMKLAMQQTTLTAGNASIPVTEVRRLTETGHQTAVISTARNLDTPVIAGRMFSRWRQENFFAYMMKHYDIDGLIQYGIESVPGTLSVINPTWRYLDKAVKKALREVRKFAAKLGAHKGLDEGGDIQKKAEYVQDMQTAQLELERLREERKKTQKKVTIDSLAENQRPTQLLPLNKQLGDTVKMIAYRAETVLVAILRRYLKNEDEARALVRELFVSSADIEPDILANTLTIRIHRMACPSHDEAISALLNELTELEFCHPETGARMTFALV